MVWLCRKVSIVMRADQLKQKKQQFRPYIKKSMDNTCLPRNFECNKSRLPPHLFILFLTLKGEGSPWVAQPFLSLQVSSFIRKISVFTYSNHRYRYTKKKAKDTTDSTKSQSSQGTNCEAFSKHSEKEIKSNTHCFFTRLNPKRISPF